MGKATKKVSLTIELNHEHMAALDIIKKGYKAFFDKEEGEVSNSDALKFFLSKNLESFYKSSSSDYNKVDEQYKKLKNNEQN